jgi:ATP-binding cassette, subfamily C (CFTR/MRP), member 1
MAQQWLKLVLNFVVAGIATILVSLATYLHASAGFTGVGLVSLLTFGGMMANLVRSWTELETSVGAVSRIKQFEDTVKIEESGDLQPVPEGWPANGVIVMNDLNVSYDDWRNLDNGGNAIVERGELNLVLRDINMEIKAGEKVAISGRTGRFVSIFSSYIGPLPPQLKYDTNGLWLRSGKSTLLSVLLRLYDPLPSSTRQPTLTIDSYPLLMLSPASIRSAIITIPQDPFFLPYGFSFQANIDPNGRTTRTECEAILTTLGINALVNERGGLDAEMKGLSAGQSQLFGLARAVLRARLRRRDANENCQGISDAGGILLLDEVSSKLDADTDKLIQKVIREEFREYTIIAVAHRLETVLDFDRMIVMDSGSIKSCGKPSDSLGISISNKANNKSEEIEQ